MLSLFEKLSKMKPTTPTAEEPRQCACGGSLEGECPECNAFEKPVDLPAPHPSEEESQGNLLERLQKVGDETPVNPPNPKVSGDQLMCKFCTQLVPASDVRAHEKTCKKNPDVQKKASGSGKCPHCQKTFKHLSRHKCKQAPVTQPQQPRQEPEQPTPKQPVEESLAKPVTEPRATEAPLPRDTTDGSADYVLLLDALFERDGAMGINMIHFSDIIGPLAMAVAKENQVEHWGAVEYGRGGPLLAAKLERWIEGTAPKGFILADTQTPELRAVKEILKRRAKVIIQGVR